MIELIGGGEREYLIAHMRLKQHRIVFSDVLIEKYEKTLAEIDLMDEFREWYRYYGNIDGFFDFNSEMISEDFETELISLLKSYDHSILIKHNENVDNDIITVLDLKDINENGSDNELTRQCIPTNFILQKNSSKQNFCKWLHEIMSDEKNITIVDKYIMSDASSDILEKLYIPTFPNDSKIHIYFGDNEKSQEKISKLKKIFGSRIRMHSAKSSEFHERYIIGDTVIISIGVGLDVFECKKNVSRKDTNISVSTQTSAATIPSKVI